MKYISKITLGLGLFASLLASCKDDEVADSNMGISLDKETIAIGPDGGTESIVVTAGRNWVSSASRPWVAVSPANGFGSVEGSLAIDSTLEVTARTAQVRYRQEDNQEVILTINQFGYGKQIIPSESEIRIESSGTYDERHFDLTVSTNVEFKVDENITYEWDGEPTPEDGLTDSDLTGWITAPQNTEVDLDRKDRPRTVNIRFRWDMNTAPYSRIAKIRLVPTDESVVLVDQDGNPTGDVVVTVVQEAAVRITDDRRGDSLAVVMINEKLQSLFTYNFSDKMENWENVTLWEEGDEGMPDGALGRIRSLSFMQFNLNKEETFPKEIKYLKYLEELSVTSNTNRQTKDMEFGEEVCELEHLKRLAIVSYGLYKLPENFGKLAGTLEYLDLGSNNFRNLSDVTDVVNKDTFKELKGLELSTCRKNDTTSELAGIDWATEKLGLHIDLGTQDSPGEGRQEFIELLKWENLEYLGLSYMFIEGELPTDEELMEPDANFGSYLSSDFFEGDAYKYEKISKDTCGWLLTDREVELLGEKVKGTDIARVLPRMHNFSINLNFITGELPNWLLFHPFLMEWDPESLVMSQWEQGKDSDGKSVGFSNRNDVVNTRYVYYYGDGKTESGYPEDISVAYPGYYNKFVGGGKDWTPGSTDAGETTSKQ